jgi:hypothetical protein
VQWEVKRIFSYISRSLNKIGDTKISSLILIGMVCKIINIYLPFLNNTLAAFCYPVALNVKLAFSATHYNKTGTYKTLQLKSIQNQCRYLRA